MDNKVKFNKRELGAIIKKKYPGCSLRILNESETAFVIMVYDLTPYDNEPVIMVYYRDTSIPFNKSFDFYTKNKYFAIPI